MIKALTWLFCRIRAFFMSLMDGWVLYGCSGAVGRSRHRLDQVDPHDASAAPPVTLLVRRPRRSRLSGVMGKPDTKKWVYRFFAAPDRLVKYPSALGPR